MLRILIIAVIALAPMMASAGERYDVRDSSGRTVGSVQRNEFLNRWDVKDTSGRTTQTIRENQFLNRLEVRDRSGKTVGTVRERR